MTLTVDKAALTATALRYTDSKKSGENEIRTREASFETYRISNPALSATQPSLRDPSDLLSLKRLERRDHMFVGIRFQVSVVRDSTLCRNRSKSRSKIELLRWLSPQIPKKHLVSSELKTHLKPNSRSFTTRKKNEPGRDSLTRLKRCEWDSNPRNNGFAIHRLRPLGYRTIYLVCFSIKLKSLRIILTVLTVTFKYHYRSARTGLAINLFLRTIFRTSQEKWQ